MVGQTKPEGEEVFNCAAWLKEGWRGMRRSLRPPGLPEIPEPFLVHSRNARREMLLACRSLLDAAIERLEKNAPKTTKVEVRAK